MAKTQKGYGKGEGRGCVSPIGGAVRPPETMKGGGDSGPVTIKPIPGRKPAPTR